MSQEQALEIIQKIFQAIFENDNPFSLEEIKDFFAFDLCLPERVKDSITNQLTWVNPCRNKAFITNFNMQKKEREEGWMREKQDIHNLKELLTLWEDVNLMTTEESMIQKMLVKVTPFIVVKIFFIQVIAVIPKT